jgi:AbiTii
MTSLVLELQHEAMDPSVRVDDLLRKAVVVATTLGIDDFRIWAAKELQGYAGDPTIPAYRQVTGVVRAFHPSRGWIPVVVPDKDLQKRLESRAAGEPISELEDLYHDPHRGDMLLLGPGPENEKLTLEDLMELVPYSWVLRIFGDTREYQPGTIPTLMISRPTIKGILDAVRNEVLLWSFALEGQGIPGEENR